MDDWIPTTLIFVLSVNFILILGQAAISDVSASIGTYNQFYNGSGTMICNHDTNKCKVNGVYVPSNTDPAGDLPQNIQVEAGDGSIFTDPIGSITKWFTDKISYLTGLLVAPVTVLTKIGLPSTAVFVIAASWYLFSLFLIVAFFWGR